MASEEAKDCKEHIYRIRCYLIYLKEVVTAPTNQINQENLVEELQVFGSRVVALINHHLNRAIATTPFCQSASIVNVFNEVNGLLISILFDDAVFQTTSLMVAMMKHFSVSFSLLRHVGDYRNPSVFGYAIVSPGGNIFRCTTTNCPGTFAVTSIDALEDIRRLELHYFYEHYGMRIRSLDILAVGSSNWHVQKAFFDSLSEKEKVRGLINAAQGCLRDSLQNQADTIAPDGQIPPTQQPTGPQQQ